MSISVLDDHFRERTGIELNGTDSAPHAIDGESPDPPELSLHCQ